VVSKDGELFSAEGPLLASVEVEVENGGEVVHQRGVVGKVGYTETLFLF